MTEKTTVTEKPIEAEKTSDNTVAEDDKKNPLKSFSRAALAVIAALLVWQVLADRYTPYTSDARVQAYIVPISAQVSGAITELSVANNEVVEAGDVLLTLDTTDYDIAVHKARAELEKAGQAVGADIASVATAKTNLADAIEDLKYAQLQSGRAFELEKKGVLSTVDADKVRNKLVQAKANVETAQSRLEQEEAKLGPEGQDNPRIQSALTALNQAELNLSRTVVRAPSRGGVTNLTLDVGHYAKPGEPLMTFVSTRAVWVEAYVRENALGNIQAGDAVELVLDAAPGRIFKGVVSTRAFGVDWGQKSKAGQLPSVSNSGGWLRESQSFPVLIQFENDDAQGIRRVGGQVDVMIYTEKSFVMKAIGKAWIRIVSLLSFLH